MSSSSEDDLLQTLQAAVGKQEKLVEDIDMDDDDCALCKTRLAPGDKSSYRKFGYFPLHKLCFNGSIVGWARLGGGVGGGGWGGGKPSAINP
jgi:hypothetical protein